MKKEIDKLDATPLKRIYNSIIADYDLKRSICELVDNGLDVWVRSGKKGNICIEITLDPVQQTITVEDDAGGLKREEMRYIVGPGHTGTNSSDATIGIFGVGTKRAVVALAEDVKIITRHRGDKTYQVDFDDQWIEDASWILPVYEVDAIKEGSTMVRLQRLRAVVTDETISQLREHLATTYARFIASGRVTLRLNGSKLSPTFFENWAYPPKYAPRRFISTLPVADGEVKVEVTAGLSTESSPAIGEYGVYFYCNDRLVARAMKTFDVGFTKGIAGAPHPKISLTRVIVSLSGEARYMPWNSSKSDVDTKNAVFISLRPLLLQAVKDYAALSRGWVGDWENKVFRYPTGSIENVFIADLPAVRKSSLPPLPKSRPRYGDVIATKNKKIAAKKPWAKGLYEGVIAADLVAKQTLEQKNRIALIVLDSTLEIAYKEYLVHESGAHYSNAKLLSIFAQRHLVQQEVEKFVKFTKDEKRKIPYYYDLRCKLVHERATVPISDPQIEDFRKIVEAVLKRMYKLHFKDE